MTKDPDKLHNLTKLPTYSKIKKELRDKINYLSKKTIIREKLGKIPKFG